MAPRTPRPLEGIRVLDFTSVVLGPFATQIMGDLGADVIKVEAPEGDVTRTIAPFRHADMGAMFLNLNRNKRSLAVDLKSAAGRAVIERLAATADVLIHSMRPQAMRRLGLDDAGLRRLNPRLIYCGAYGFSERGRYAGRPAYDDIIQAASGLAWLQGVNLDAPRYANSVVADKITGLTALYAILAALLQRERTGAGQTLEVSMLEAMVAFLLPEHMAGATFAPRLSPPGYKRLFAPQRRPYAAKDGFIAVLPYTSDHWRKFFAAVGRPDLIDDPRFCDNTRRSENIEALYEILAAAIRARTVGEWTALLDAADIPAMPVKSLEDVLSDPHLAEVGLFYHLLHPSEGEIRVPGPAVRFAGMGDAPARMPPRLGAQSREILAEAGYARDEIDALIAAGTVVTPQD